MIVLLAKQMDHVMQPLHVKMVPKQIHLRIVNLVHMTGHRMVQLVVMQHGMHMVSIVLH